MMKVKYSDLSLNKFANHITNIRTDSTIKDFSHNSSSTITFAYPEFLKNEEKLSKASLNDIFSQTLDSIINF